MSIIVNWKIEIPALCPANFFTTFLVESILRILPNVDVNEALIKSIMFMI